MTDEEEDRLMDHLLGNVESYYLIELYDVIARFKSKAEWDEYVSEVEGQIDEENERLHGAFVEQIAPAFTGAEGPSTASSAEAGETTIDYRKLLADGLAMIPLLIDADMLVGFHESDDGKKYDYFDVHYCRLRDGRAQIEMRLLQEEDEDEYEPVQR